jgi:hypothetical protein
MIESALIEKVLRKHGLLEIYREQEPALLWEKIVGPRVARFAQPIWVHQGVLFVAVPNHIVQHEFSLLREEFKNKTQRSARRRARARDPFSCRELP